MRASRVSSLVLLVVLVLVIVGTFMSGRCGEDGRQAIRVDENRVVITNVSEQAWSDIEVWLNTWYRAQAPSLAPGQRLEIPLRVFVAGPGRNFDARAQGALGILVTGRTSDGAAVNLVWGDGKKPNP